VQAYVDGGEVTGQTAGQPYQVGSSTLSFGTDGNRVSPIPATDFTGTPAWNNGSTAGSIKFSFTPFTQFSEGSATTSVTQDGTGTGRVVAFSVDEGGKLLAKLDNGQSSTIGTVALASFADQERLQRVGQSLFSQSSDSGEPVLGTPGSGIFGKVESGTLELSSADIASDFVKLISLQRGYQGCSRVISTINQLTEELVNLAR
jgi:flagellar hook protein FlgE